MFSMGGSVAAKLAEKLNVHSESKEIIKGRILLVKLTFTNI